MKKILIFTGILITSIVSVIGVIIGLSLAAYFHPFILISVMAIIPIIALGILITKEVYGKIYPQIEHPEELSKKLDRMLKEVEK